MRFLFLNCSKHDWPCVGPARCGNIKTVCLSRDLVLRKLDVLSRWLRDSEPPRHGHQQLNQTFVNQQSSLPRSLLDLRVGLLMDFAGLISPDRVTVWQCGVLRSRWEVWAQLESILARLTSSQLTMGEERGKVWQSSVKPPPELVTFYRQGLVIAPRHWETSDEVTLIFLLPFPLQWFS